jgi:hypothetical protein
VRGASIVGCQRAAMRRAADVHHLLRPAELVDGFGDEAVRPGLSRALDLGVAATATTLGFVEDARVSRGERLVGEERTGFRDLAVRQVDSGRGRPVLAE